MDPRTDRPQPRLDLERGGGMTVTVGRVRPCPILDIRMVVLGHNTIRGAAGQAVQIAELLGGRRASGPPGMIVAKFGGTSVADATAIRRLIEIVRGRAGARPVVVVSALAGVTDALLALRSHVEAGQGAAVDVAVLGPGAAARRDRHASYPAPTRQWSRSAAMPNRSAAT